MLAGAQRGGRSPASREVILPALVPAHPDVQTSGVLVRHGDRAVTMGEIVTVAGVFVNHGEVAMNVSGVVASMHDPSHFGTYLQNFSGACNGGAAGR